MNLLIPTYSQKVEETIKNELVDRLDSKSLTDVIIDVYEDLTHWQDIKNPVISRQCRRFCEAFTEEEIKQHIKTFIIKKTGYRDNGNINNTIFIEGAWVQVAALIVAILGVTVGIGEWYDTDEGDFDPESIPDWSEGWQDFYNHTGGTVVGTEVVNGEDGKDYLLMTMSDGSVFKRPLNGEYSD